MAGSVLRHGPIHFPMLAGAVADAPPWAHAEPPVALFEAISKPSDKAPILQK